MMDIFMDSPTEGEEAGGFFLGGVVADSQISDIDLSSQPLIRDTAYAPFTPSFRPPLGDSGPSSTVSQPPSTTGHSAPRPAVHQNIERDGPTYRHQSKSRRNRHNSSTSMDSWDPDMDFFDSEEPAHNSNASQQDLAERIGNLTKAINANAAFCLEVSGKMIELARENKHLLDASRWTLDTYVLQPALKVPGLVKYYYPGFQEGLQDGVGILKEYELQFRRMVQNCANGREMARVQGVGAGTGDGNGGRGEMTRLKDRLVEQDALLRDSSQHVQKLIREREALKKQLNQKKRNGAARETVAAGTGSVQSENPELPETCSDPDEDYDDGKEVRLNSDRDMAALADHLREMRVLMDRLALHELSNHERQKPTTKRDGPSDDLAVDDEDPEWTLL